MNLNDGEDGHSEDDHEQSEDGNEEVITVDTDSVLADESEQTSDIPASHTLSLIATNDFQRLI